MAIFFVRNNHDYNLRSKSKLPVLSINIVFKGQNTISYFGLVIWKSILVESREITTFQVFKSEIKTLQRTDCPCRLCKNYKENLRLVNNTS